MHTGPTRQHNTPRQSGGLTTLASLFALALILTWLLSSGPALSFFQSPTSPLAPTETPRPTRVPTEAKPSSTPTPQVSAPTATPTASPTEMEELAPTPTIVVVSPTVQAAQPTAAPPEHPSSAGGVTLWPWILLGLVSIGAIVGGVFLLRREAPAEKEEE